MRRALLLFVVALAGCVDLEKGRPWRCERSADCSSGWLCLKDGFCHDPAVGAAVPCASPEDCVGGWLCGQAGQCLDPTKPAAFPCAHDWQCAGGWRCAARGTCVDFASEPQPAALSSVGASELVSPLSEAGDLLVTSPRLNLGPPGTTHSVAVARRSVTAPSTVEVVSFAAGQTDNKQATYFATLRAEFEFPFAPRDLAVTAGMLVAQRADGALVRALADGGVAEVPLAEAPERLVPLSWTDGVVQHGAAVLAVGPTKAWVVLPEGTTVPAGDGVLDAVAEVQPDGGLGLLLLRRGVNDFVTLAPGLGEKEVPVLSRDGGPEEAPVGLRVEAGTLAVQVAANGIVGSSAVRLGCRGCAEPLGPMLRCSGLFTATDFGVVTDSVTPVPAALCGGGGRQLLYTGLDAQPISVRPGLVAGASGAHVRQLEGGQLLFGQHLLEEVPSALVTRPRQLGFVDGALSAIVGRELFVYGGPESVGLALALRSDDPDTIIVSLVEGTNDTLLFSLGFTLRDDSTGGRAADFFVNAPEALTDATAELLHLRDGGTLFVVTDQDTLYAAAGQQDDTAVAEPRLKPSAGFPLTDLVVREADAGLAEGWAIANNRLFRVTASTAERWRASEATPAGRDPLGVWFSGPAALLGTAEGEVLALPAGVPISTPLGAEVTSIDGQCGATVATTSTGVFQLTPAADGGLATWTPVSTPELDQPQLLRSSGRLFVADQQGVVLELPVNCR